MGEKKALIMIDLQNDFCEGGQLAVPDGDAVIPLANQLQSHYDLIIATKDWHPQDHVSFASNHPQHTVGDVMNIEGIDQVLWPDHCVQNSQGSEWHPQLITNRVNQVFYKGTDKNIDSYSAFFDNKHLRSTGLAEYLHAQNVKDIYLMGLATDYCVKFSSLDAIHCGFRVHVIEDACRGVELHPGDITRSFQEMQKAGVKLVQARDILQSNR